MQRNTICENIEIFIVTKNSTFRYQLLLWYTESKRNLTSQTHYRVIPYQITQTFKVQVVEICKT